MANILKNFLVLIIFLSLSTMASEQTTISDHQPELIDCTPKSITLNRLMDFFLKFTHCPRINSLQELEALQIMDFSTTDLSGELPYELGELSQLRSINISNTGISGEIPLSLVKCKNLKRLDVGNTHLQGEVPTELLSRLKYLNIICTKITCPHLTIEKHKGMKFCGFFVNEDDWAKGTIRFESDEFKYVNAEHMGHFLNLCTNAKNQQGIKFRLLTAKATGNLVTVHFVNANDLEQWFANNVYGQPRDGKIKPPAHFHIERCNEIKEKTKGKALFHIPISKFYAFALSTDEFVLLDIQEDSGLLRSLVGRSIKNPHTGEWEEVVEPVEPELNSKITKEELINLFHQALLFLINH